MKWLKQYSRTLSWSIPGRHQALSLSGCSEVITAEMCLCWKNKLLPTVGCLSLSPPPLQSLCFFPGGAMAGFFKARATTFRVAEHLYIQNTQTYRTVELYSGYFSGYFRENSSHSRRLVKCCNALLPLTGSAWSQKVLDLGWCSSFSSTPL